MIATKQFADLELSRLMLGTVQFGLEYGIANKTGCPSYETVRSIIACAYEAGVNCLDTAANYGASEEVLGRVLDELKLKDKMIVASKVMALPDPPLSAQKAERKMEKSITRSLKRLRLEVLPICLFHKEKNFCYIESLLKLKEKGLIRHAGVSVMTAEATADILATGKAECIQLPTNVFDHRFRKAGIFTQAAESGKALFIRSIYLQGLLLMPEGDILPKLAEVIPVRRRLKLLADQAGMTMADMCVRYVLSINGTTSILVGVDTLEQLRENISLFSSAPLGHDLKIAIENMVPDFPDTILMPTKWSKRMK